MWTEKLQEWENKVIALAGTKCTENGCYEDDIEFLQAHHIKEREDAPELELELTNGQSLCIYHHAQKHKSDVRAYRFLMTQLAEKLYKKYKGS